MKSLITELIEQHDYDTKFCSVMGHMKSSSTSYNSIIEKGEEAIPYILEYLRAHESGMNIVMLLMDITKEYPYKPEKLKDSDFHAFNVKDCVDTWIRWGVKKKYISNYGGIKIINLKKDKGVHYDKYIGRRNQWLGLEQSEWANPFILKRESDRDEILAQYKEYIIRKPNLIEGLRGLTGLTLACYCCNYHNNKLIGKKCHGMILIEVYDLFMINI